MLRARGLKINDLGSQEERQLKGQRRGEGHNDKGLSGCGSVRMGLINREVGDAQ